MNSGLLRIEGGKERLTSSAGLSDLVFAEKAGIPSTQNKSPVYIQVVKQVSIITYMAAGRYLCVCLGT